MNATPDNTEEKEQPSPPVDRLLLPQILTIIVTTSPIKSNPSTEVMERTFNTFHLAGYDFAYTCPKVIICDGCRILDEMEKDVVNDENTTKTVTTPVNNSTSREKGHLTQPPPPPKVSRKHANVKQALRNGIVTKEQAEKYTLYKRALKTICAEAATKGSSSTHSSTTPSPFQNTRVVELEERHGYGFTLRHALQHEVSTPYICVIQHDRTFMRTTPIESIMDAMVQNQHVIKYVGMSMKSNLVYRDIFLSKYGKKACDKLCALALSPPQLALDSRVFGPEGSSVKNMQFESESVKKNAQVLAQSYKGTIQYSSHNSDLVTGNTTTSNSNNVRVEGQLIERKGSSSNKHQLSLTPVLFWYDNTHICETAHYRDFIFHPKYRLVARGGFVEDKVSPAITRCVQKHGLEKGHSKFGCYIVDDHSGFFFTGHLDGGSYLTMKEKSETLGIHSSNAV